MKTLLQRSTESCGRDAPALKQDELLQYLEQLPGWRVESDGNTRWLEKHYSIRPYTSALAFVQAVGELAEAANHHPEIKLEWGKVSLRWWTHTINDIHLNDCILAARCEQQLAPDND